MPDQKKTPEAAYSFYRYENTDEIHIWKGRFTADDCFTAPSCICQKVSRTKDTVRVVKRCLNEDEARKKVSQLYTTDY